MNGRLVWRVMWKEYRALRGLWIAVAVASWLAQVVILLTARDLGLLEVALGAALVTPVFYVFGAASAVFASEHEEGADRLLLALPTRLPSLAVGKMAFVALSTLALMPAAGILALWALSGSAGPRAYEQIGELAFIWAPAILEGFVWGLFFSLLCRSVMQAAILATLAAALTVSVALHLSNGSAIDGIDPRQYAETLWPRLGIVLVVLAADLALARRWLSTGAPVADRERAPAQAGSGSWSARLASFSRWQSRLTWQQLRQSSRMMALVLIVPMSISLLLPQLSEKSRIPSPTEAGISTVDVAWEITLILIAALVGCTVFAADKRGNSYRCLAEQGCGAGAVWFNRQAFALAWLATGIVVWHLAWWLRFGLSERPVAVFQPFHYDHYGSGRIDVHVMTWREVGAVAVAYAAGQLASLLVRGGVMSTLIGLVLAAGFYSWSLLTLFLLLPPSLSVWPFAIGMLATTAVFARRWLLDDRGLRTWALTAGTFGLFALGTLALVPTLRLEGLSHRPVEFDVEAFQATLGPEAQQTADLYRRAVETLHTRRSIEEELALPDDSAEREYPESIERRWSRGELSAIDRAWLAANQEPIRTALEANARPTCAYLRDANELQGRSLPDLVDLLRVRVIAEPDLDAQLAAYLDILRLIEHLRPGWYQFVEARSFERHVLNGLLSWSVAPGQTPERLRAARRALQEHAARTPSVEEAVKMQYVATLRRIDSDDATFELPFESYLAGLPWERQRARLLLTEWANDNLGVLHETFHDLNPQTLDRLRGYYNHSGESLQLMSTPALRSRLDGGASHGYQLADWELHRQTRLQAAVIMLELAAFRLEHGALPGSLADLVGADFPAAPLDPFTHESFEYFPQGFPIEIDQATQLSARLEEQATLGPAVLWSPGGRVSMSYQEDRGKRIRRFSTYWGNHWESLDNELAGWSAGLIFPIPAPIPTP